ncbi:hypothetical protein ACFORL_10520 [Legionella dresdenensis]|uniref:Coiled-coil protein n=1 Tax=Legionella dresdenensis TaxID=450200 RepID=A0ABV8CHM4_9GAMM
MPDNANRRKRYLRKELTTAVNIQKQLQAVINKLPEKYISSEATLLGQIVAKKSEDCLKQMLHADEQETYLMHEKQLLELLSNFKRKLAIDDNKEQLAAFAEIEATINQLRQTRFRYLRKALDRNKLLGEAGWMGTGMGLVTAATVLGTAFPALLVPGIVVGAVVLGYSVVDFVKDSYQFYSEATHDEANPDLTGFAEFDVEKLSGAKAVPSKRWSNEKRLVKGLAVSASFAGFALAVVAFAFVFPGAGVPFAAVIGIAAAGVVVAAAAIAVLGYEARMESKEIANHQRKIEQQIAHDHDELNDIELELKGKAKLTSTATICLQEQERQPTVNPAPAAEEEKQEKEAPAPEPASEIEEPQELQYHTPESDVEEEASDESESEGETKELKI